MKLILVMLLALSASMGPRPSPQDGGDGTRFGATHVYVVTTDASLAAYQLEVAATRPGATVVGVEGGASALFAEPPYYDPAAIQNERVIIGAFTTAADAELPRGRVRVATIHWQIDGTGVPDLRHTLQAAATVDGREIAATIELEWDDGS